MTYIKNKSQLLSHGNLTLRRAVLDIIEHALAGVDPYKATRDIVRLKSRVLSVGDLNFDLDTHKRIFLLGGGKATYPIAKALEEILGDRITDGVVICKYGQEGALRFSRMLLASHPIPDEAGYQASLKAIELAKQTKPGDIVFGCVTGGSSALMPLPVPGVSLEEKKLVNMLLLTCGANIYEINAVRKHLSRIKGGKLAQAIHPDAHLINLTVSDVTNDELDYITDPLVPDTSYFENARATLTKYHLWNKVPESVQTYLKNAGANEETPKQDDFADRSLQNFILVKSARICDAAAEKAEELGFNTMILSTTLEGESCELGRTFAAISKEIVSNHRPLSPPCAIIGGGETTVKIDGEFGSGGPNQEFALAAACEIADMRQVLVAGIDSDGTDGPTDFAGGLVDGGTLMRAQDAGIDLHDSLRRHDVLRSLQDLDDIVETGATGTNVNDLKMLLVLPAEDPE
ncbi:MAG: glycerate kinase [Deltaproteobacteria bacterium]|nr:glycerate kinase [Deltaproteobacteria bacterium]